MADTSDSTTPVAATHPPRKPENLWLNLACNVILPGLIMSKLAAPERLGPLWALVAGVSLPLGYGIYDLISRKKVNIFSIVGLASVGLTGGLGLANASALVFAIKEAAIPTVFGLAVLATMRTRRPLVRELLLNESVIDLPKIDDALAARGTQPEFDGLIRVCTWWIAGGFVLSAVLNFVLARVLLTAEPGSTAFTEQLGHMNWWSWPVITIPFMAIMFTALIKLLKGLHRLTGLELEAIMHPRPAAKKG